MKGADFNALTQAAGAMVLDGLDRRVRGMGGRGLSEGDGFVRANPLPRRPWGDGARLWPHVRRTREFITVYDSYSESAKSNPPSWDRVHPHALGTVCSVVWRIGSTILILTEWRFPSNPYPYSVRDGARLFAYRPRRRVLLPAPGPGALFIDGPEDHWEPDPGFLLGLMGRMTADRLR